MKDNYDEYLKGIINSSIKFILREALSHYQNINYYKTSPFESIECPKTRAELELLKYKTIIQILEELKFEISLSDAPNKYIQLKIDSIESRAIQLIQKMDLNINFNDIKPLKNSYINNCSKQCQMKLALENELGDYLLGLRNSSKSKETIKKYIKSYRKDQSLINDPKILKYTTYITQEENE